MNKNNIMRKNNKTDSKLKNRSRYLTKLLLKRGEVEIDGKCKVCNSLQPLEIHHKDYPITPKAVKEAVKKGSIYYLCVNCHLDQHNYGKISDENRTMVINIRVKPSEAEKLRELGYSPTGIFYEALKEFKVVE